MTWASSLDFGGYEDWRLPQTLTLNGIAYTQTGNVFNGSSDRGYNISAPGSAYPGTTQSEMAYLYYTTLGNPGRYTVDGTGPLFVDNTPNPGPFENLQTDGYWSLSCPTEDAAWNFRFNSGNQLEYPKSWEFFAIAVRDGDTGPSASVGNSYNTTMLLGQTISFDYWWEMGQEPEGFNLDILFLHGGEWKSLFGWKFNLDGSSTEWETASFMVPEYLRGLESQIRFQVFDFGVDTDPTVYLNNITSSTAPVPEPATTLLLASGLVGLAGVRRRSTKRKTNIKEIPGVL